MLTDLVVNPKEIDVSENDVKGQDELLEDVVSIDGRVCWANTAFAHKTPY